MYTGPGTEQFRSPLSQIAVVTVPAWFNVVGGGGGGGEVGRDMGTLAERRSAFFMDLLTSLLLIGGCSRSKERPNQIWFSVRRSHGYRLLFG